MRAVILILGLVLLSGCASTIDCFVEDKPEWEQRSLAQGMRFQPYHQSIGLEGATNFSIREFRVEGKLPDGLSAEFNGVTATISGTPVKLGNFDFKLKVKADYIDTDGSSSSCGSSSAASYSIRVD